jgi:hypothetical protein
MVYQNGFPSIPVVSSMPFHRWQQVASSVVQQLTKLQTSNNHMLPETIGSIFLDFSSTAPEGRS